MTFLTALGAFNYGLVLIYGLFLSAQIAGGWTNRQQKRLILILCPLFLLLQTPCWLMFGESITKQLYPLIVHLPLVLILIFALKKPVGIALVSVCTAYLCCQLPRWAELAVTAVTRYPLAGEISYTLVIYPVFLLLCHYFVGPAYSAMTVSRQSLLLFGSLPVAYYFFDYATVVYSDALSKGTQAINEFLPTAIIIFYVMFLSAYHRQLQIRADANLQRSMLEAELKQAEVEVESLRSMETQVAVYQHDMRHHLTAIDGFLAADQPQRAREYIQKVQADVDAITPKRFCENELVNLLCSSFAHKANAAGIRLTVDAKLPKTLPLPDTELCSLLSNGLENALHAVGGLKDSSQWVEFYCGIRLNKLLIEIKNPYTGQITMRDGLPVSGQDGHGYGCRSIRSIAERHQGLFSFEPEHGVFTLHVILPLKDE
ncbi:MAG: GHKL domain-containing protein [Lachnospiraceae bacterium]|nr:GHKL domain-containing protein [Lachnospiraceae bacterium]MDY5102249.1 GHKL domain-containing protein [Agathobacter sp.]